MRLERLDVRVKLVGFLVVVIVVFLLEHPLGNAALAAALLAVVALGGLPLRGVWTMLQPLLVIFGLIVLVTAVTTGPFAAAGPTRVLVSWGGLDVTVGGLLVGLNFVARIVAMVIATYAFTASTPIDDLLLVLGQLRAPSGLAIVVTTAMSFVPTMVTTKNQIEAAQQARGARPAARFGRIASSVALMVPLITTSIQLADRLAVAMTSRGFGAHRTMTAMRQLRLRPSDWVGLGVVLVGLGLVCWLRFGLGYGAV
ncbi:MAG: energy-coupling factor transporter transmembrane component T [Propionicimonas sp.]